MPEITREMFVAATHGEPEKDDLDRCNCPQAGTLGHLQCGWNHQKSAPIFMVGPEDTNGNG